MHLSVVIESNKVDEWEMSNFPFQSLKSNDIVGDVDEYENRSRVNRTSIRNEILSESLIEKVECGDID